MAKVRAARRGLARGLGAGRGRREERERRERRGRAGGAGGEGAGGAAGYDAVCCGPRGRRQVRVGPARPPAALARPVLPE